MIDADVGHALTRLGQQDSKAYGLFPLQPGIVACLCNVFERAVLLEQGKSMGLLLKIGVLYIGTFNFCLIHTCNTLVQILKNIKICMI